MLGIQTLWRGITPVMMMMALILINLTLTTVMSLPTMNQNRTTVRIKSSTQNNVEKCWRDGA